MKYNITKKILKETIGKDRKKVDEILYELLWNYHIDISERQWRLVVNEFNKDYGKNGLYIASNRNGYILTSKKKEIKATAINKLKVGISMIKNSKLTLKELEDANQLKLLDEDEIKIYNIVKAFE